MFAALMLVRLREAANTAAVLNNTAWQSPDDVTATDLPLAKATEKALASMHAVLTKTARVREEELSGMNEEDEKKAHVRRTKASEVRVVRYAEELRHPTLEGLSVKFKAEPVDSKLAEGAMDEAPTKTAADMETL